MDAPDGLPGERTEWVTRPSPWSYTGRYLMAASPALLGLLLWWWFTSDGWHAEPEGVARFWSFLWGGIVPASVYAVAGSTMLGLVAAWAWQDWRLTVPFVVAGLAGVALAVVADSTVYDHLLPALLMPWSFLYLGAAEARRRTRQIRFTNLRVIELMGQKATAQVHYARIVDVDLLQNPIARWLGVGTLVVIGDDADDPDRLERIAGVARVTAVRDLIRAMTRRVETTPFARGDQSGQAQVEEALATLRGAPGATDG